MWDTKKAGPLSPARFVTLASSMATSGHIQRVSGQALPLKTQRPRQNVYLLEHTCKRYRSGSLQLPLCFPFVSVIYPNKLPV